MAALYPDSFEHARARAMPPAQDESHWDSSFVANRSRLPWDSLPNSTGGREPRQADYEKYAHPQHAPDLRQCPARKPRTQTKPWE